MSRADQDAYTAILWFGLFFLALALYCLPWIVAKARHKRNVTAIAVLNILAGWTFLGWLIALVWALLVEDRPRPEQRVLPHHVRR